jgi:hypothetical protein
MEVGLIAESGVGTPEVGCELMVQLFLGVSGAWGQVHEPQQSYADQGYREVVGHDGLIPSYSEDGDRVGL